jgi:excisionase family DNA binding protein
MNETWGIKEAAAFLRIHPDTLAERARAGEIPGCKIGRSWVFMPDLLTEYVRSRCAANVTARPFKGSASASLAERLAARREQMTAGRRKH